MASWITGGTLTFTNGGTSVAVASGTPNFAAAGVSPGDILIGPDGKLYQVQAPVTNAGFSIAPAYAGATVTSATYDVVALNPSANATAVANLMAALANPANAALAGKFGDGTVTLPGMTFTSATGTGFSRRTDGGISFSYGGVLGWCVDGTGNMGVGSVGDTSEFFAVRKDQAGTTVLSVTNYDTAAETAAATLMVTGSANSSKEEALCDNAGSPYYRELWGSAVSAATYYGNKFVWANLSNVVWLALGSGTGVGVGPTGDTSATLVVRQDSPIGTYVLLKNQTSGTGAYCAFQMQGSESGSYAYTALFDNSGAPYLANNVGSSVSYVSYTAPEFLWQNSASVLATLTNAGWLGLGATTPAAKLHLAGDTGSTGLAAGNAGIYFTDTNATYSHQWNMGPLEDEFYLNDITNNIGYLYFGGSAIKPGSDDTLALGTSSLRWAVVYAASGVITTSDARQKTFRDTTGAFSDAELRVATRISELFRVYQFNSAVEKKGAAARLHAGVAAQDVEAAFAAEGLDAASYGLWCQDDVTAKVKRTLTTQQQKTEDYTDSVESVSMVDGKAVLTKSSVVKQRGVFTNVGVVDASGNPVMIPSGGTNKDGTPIMIERVHREPVMEDVTVTKDVEQPAGQQQGVRYSELFAWVSAALASQITALAARVAALEARGSAHP